MAALCNSKEPECQKIIQHSLGHHSEKCESYCVYFFLKQTVERFRTMKVRLAVRSECGRKLAYEIRRCYVSHFAKFEFRGSRSVEESENFDGCTMCNLFNEHVQVKSACSFIMFTSPLSFSDNGSLHCIAVCQNFHSTHRRWWIHGQQGFPLPRTCLKKTKHPLLIYRTRSCACGSRLELPMTYYY